MIMLTEVMVEVMMVIITFAITPKRNDGQVTHIEENFLKSIWKILTKLMKGDSI